MALWACWISSAKNRQDEAKVDDCLDKINLSASHLLALVNDVLDMNKLESGKETIESASFDLTHLMDDVASLVNAQITEMGITHCTHRGELTHTRLIGSPLRLRQIMLNLFSNAIKYNKPGGMIDTYAGEVSCDGTRVVYEFRITDSGIGMSSEFIEKELFHPFTQEKSGARTQYKGTGLGMSIVKELIEKMQGTIEVTSQQGVGTTYVFRLPFYIDCEGQRIQEVKTRIAGKELVRFHVLLVEDNEINMEIAEFYLKELGSESPMLVHLIMKSLHKENKRKVKHIGCKRFGIQYLLKGIYVHNDLLYLHTEIKNQSNVPFDVDYITFKIVDKKVAKRTAIQEQVLFPLRAYNYAVRVAGKKSERTVFCLQKFTIPDGKQLVVEMNEKNGGRHQTFTVENEDLVQAETINELRVR